MADEHETENPPAPPAPPANPNRGLHEPPARHAPTPPPDEGDEDPAALKAELERTRKALKDANRISAEKRARLEELERIEQERKDNELTEAERVRKAADDAARARAEAERRAAAAEAALVQTRIDHAVEREAARLGFQYPDIAAQLVDRRKITVDEDGKIAGVKDTLEKLLKDKPGLAASGPRGGTPPRDTPRGGAPVPNGRAADAPRPLTPEEDLRAHHSFV